MGDEGRLAKAAIAALIQSRTLAEWTTLLEEVDGCASPVLRLDEVIRHPNTQTRGMIVTGQRPDGDGADYQQYAFPLKMTDYEFSIDRPPPLLGEHNEEVLGALGQTAADIAALRQQGII
jgi:crotonobetainyl-CoA:carnitine CoA-transferase CaiB-like acyl-CoA transferase